MQHRDPIESGPRIARGGDPACRLFKNPLPPELSQDQFVAAERTPDKRLAAPVECWQANGTIRDNVSPVPTVELLQLVLLLAVTNYEYDKEYYHKRYFAIETLARGLEL